MKEEFDQLCPELLPRAQIHHNVRLLHARGTERASSEFSQVQHSVTHLKQTKQVCAAFSHNICLQCCNYHTNHAYMHTKQYVKFGL